MPDSYDTAREKVAAIYEEMVGNRSKILNGSALPKQIISTIAAALSGKDADEKAILKNDEIAFHLTDWNSDAAFLVALHLFPERFTPAEIQAGVDLFLVHVPSHVIAAARLSGNSTEDIFAENNNG
jgi:hypothetical protein